GRRARRACPLGGDATQSDLRAPGFPAMSQERPPQKDSKRLVAITLDENSIGRSSRDVEHERAVAIYDLLEENTFFPNDSDQGPFALHLSITGRLLIFDFRPPHGTPVLAHLP